MAKEPKEVKDLKETIIERKAVALKQVEELKKENAEAAKELDAFIADGNRQIAEMQQAIGERGLAIVKMQAAADSMDTLLEE